MQLTCEPFAFPESRHLTEPAACPVPCIFDDASIRPGLSPDPPPAIDGTSQSAGHSIQDLEIVLSRRASDDSPLSCLRYLMCSFVLHAALCVLALVFVVGGGSGGMGTGTGTGLGDGSGGNAISVSGYVQLGGGEKSGQAGTPESQPGVEEGLAMPSDLQAQIPVIQELSARDAVRPPTDREQVAEIPAEAVPIPSRKPDPKREERQQQKPPRPAVAVEERSQKIQPQPTFRKDSTPAVASVGMATSGALAGVGETATGTGSAKGTGDAQGVGVGGISGSSDAGGSGASGFGYALHMVDQVPKLLKRGPLSYPESARKKRLTGDVTVRFLLDERGEISRVHVLHAAPPDAFNNAALIAVKQWKFAPAVKDGKPVPVWVDLPLHFSLR